MNARLKFSGFSRHVTTKSVQKGTAYIGSLHFGAEKPQDTLLKRSQALREPQSPKDPQPRWGFNNIRNLLLLGASVIGGIFCQYQAIKDISSPLLSRQKQSDSEIENELTPKVDSLKPFLQSPWTRIPKGIYLQLLTFQAICIAFASGRKSLAKTISPKFLWTDIHQRGYTGQNQTIALIDTPVEKTASISHEQLIHANPFPQTSEKLTTQKDTHGTILANFIHQALPEATILSIPMPYTRTQLAQEQIDNLNNLFNESLSGPDMLTSENLVICLEPTFKHYAQAIDHAIEHHSEVINISASLSLENVIDKIDEKINWIHGHINYAKKQKLPNEELDIDQATNYEKKLHQLKNHIDSHGKISLTPQVIDAMSPWMEALERANQQNIPVVVSASDNGTNQNPDKSVVTSHLNLLGVQNHPALFVIGTANALGKIDLDSTETNNITTPVIAGNGSGEFAYHTPYNTRKRHWLEQLLLPLATVPEKINRFYPPSGTSLSAIDISTTLAMMKAVNPKINLAQLRQIITQSALQCFLQNTDENRLENDKARESLEQALKRRVGAGLICRYKAIDVANKLTNTFNLPTQILEQNPDPQ